jgi:hypothetical protein
MRNIRRITYETGLYALALVIALGLRFSGLGGTPFSQYEAGWAWQALQVSTGEGILIGPQPAYIMPTAWLFFLFGSTNFLARFLPALAGGLLVLLPLPLRGVVGRLPALIFAFGVALDPGLVAISRQAGGPGLALVFALLGIGAATAGRPFLFGLLVGLALMSGPQIWHALLIGLLAWLGWQAIIKAGRQRQAVEISGVFSLGSVFPFERLVAAWQKVLFGLATAFFLIGTLFLLVPQGFGALANGLPAYLSSWLTPSGVPFLSLLATLVLYQPLALVFGLSGVLRAWTNTAFPFVFARWLTVWIGVALVVTALYPGRQVMDIGWILAPLWGLAALELSLLLFPADRGYNRWISSAQAAFIISLMAFAWINMGGYANLQAGLPDELRNVLVLMAGALAMVLLTALLIGLGWSWQTSRWGLTWGVFIGLAFYGISNMWGSTYLRQNRVTELWYPEPGVGQAGQLLSTMRDLSIWQSGHVNQLNVVVLADTARLRWHLRDWRNAQFARGLYPGDLPEVILAYEGQENPRLAVSYRGQGFVWEEYRRWTGILPDNWSRWMVSREAPRLENKLILWVRTDLFPGGEVQSETGPGGEQGSSSQSSGNLFIVDDFDLSSGNILP